MDKIITAIDNACYEIDPDFEMPEGIFYASHVPLFDSYHIFYEDDESILPGMLQSIVRITSNCQPLDKDGLEKIAYGLIILFERTKEIMNIAQGQKDLALKLAANAGVEVTGFEVTMAAPYDSKFDSIIRLASEVEINIINEAYTQEYRTYIIEPSNGDLMTRFKKVLSLQESRRRKIGAPLMVDSVTSALLEMTDEDKTNLINLISRAPFPTRDLFPSGQMPKKWTKTALGQKGCIVPENIETLEVKDGRIAGKIRIGKNATWNSGILTIAQKSLPVSIEHNMVGRRLTEIIEHPALASAGKITSVSTKSGRIRIKAEVESINFQ